MRFSYLISLVVIVIIVFSITSCRKGRLRKIKSWVCYYQDEFPDGKMPDYDLYVLDKQYHPPLKPIHDNKKKAVGYISFGEVEQRESHFQRVHDQKLVVDENENWPDSYRVDMANPEWHKIILDELIPYVLSQDFDGIFIDTIDTAEYLEDVKKLSGQRTGAAQLIKKVRTKYPNIIIVMNNGLFMADQVGKQIDALVIEDIYTLYDFKKKSYNLAKKDWTDQRLKRAKAFQKIFKKPVLPLEYLKRDDKEAIQKITDEAKNEGFIPYISNIGLSEIFFHP
ncbi:MAG: hypothetical protein HN337_05785 [Deltaproteobacteria bacterium]|jgi:polysaccharide biosynthesis protein PelA|nr:hypothetical protein [Deltaproteobacteria bacterium]